MENKLLHTPEGVRDVYNGECKRKLVLQNFLTDTIIKYGYHAIQTPTFEFFDIFSREIGTTPSKELYKFFDKDGETLVLRPDMTPSVARCAAKYFMEENSPLRFYYSGNTFINNHASYQGRLNENTQIGAELIGDASIEADAEIVAMIVECLQKSGLKEFQVSIGEVKFFKSILEEAGIEGEDEETLRDLISNKNFFGVEEFLEEKKFSKDITAVLTKLPNMYGSIETLNEAKKLTNNKNALDALNRLQKLYDTISLYGMEKYISFDLGMLSKYQYYTGIIIKAYTYGLGEPVCTGGRYDKLLKSFGKDAASIGFCINLEQLMSALSRQKIEIPVDSNNIIISYNESDLSTAIKLATLLRNDGINVELNNKEFDYMEYAKNNNIAGILKIKSATECTYTNTSSQKSTDLACKDVSGEIIGRY